MSDSRRTSDDIWADDHLGRREEATYLSGYLAARYQAKTAESGFVLAVNGDWGMGKSFMLDRWSQDMKLAGHPVVSFNSWENDFTPEPLVAFIAELDSALGPYFDMMPLGRKLRAKWYEQAKAVLIPTLKIAGFALAKHGAGLGAEKLADIYNTDDGDADLKGNDDDSKEKDGLFDTKDLGEKLNKVIEEELKSHSNTKKAIAVFKERLEILIKHLAQESAIQLPICVFIDELDRCRPDYAIRLLEGIKHLFGVPGLHFIVATNLPELAHSVRAVYGSGFSADRYLKRFFDMEYSLPLPDGKKFALELMSPLATLTQAKFITGFEQLIPEDGLPAKALPFIFLKNAEAFDLPLRDQQQVARILEAALLSLNNAAVHIHFLIFLTMLYQKSSQVYHKVAKAKNLADQTGFPDIFPRHEFGLITIPTFDNEGSNKNVWVNEVASIYFNFINNNNPRGSINSYDFPANLYPQILQARHDVSTISNYIEIVRRAGRFSK